MVKTGYLKLENGQVFEGESIGFEKDVAGEVVFSTGMVGYPESFTDPSFYGQILVETYPLIGNYGVPDEKNTGQLTVKFESAKIQIRALIISQYIDNISHYDGRRSLREWLVKHKIPCLSGIDTRTLTKTIRQKGVLKGIISFKKTPIKSGLFVDINSQNLVPFVSVKKPEIYGRGRIRVLFIDCGLKENQIRLMLKYDTTIIRVPWDYNPFKVTQAPEFDTVFISNGPGDARTMPETIETIKKAYAENIPTFGICLGHQIMALAAGGDIFKLKYGHRGQNQPVQDISSGKCYITSQNHGFSVIDKTLPKDWVPWFINLNDGTNEGLMHKNKPFFCVQFHPEDAPGPRDCQYLFEYYFESVKKWPRI